MKKSWTMALCAVVVLAACGGGDDETPAVTAEVPATASGSIDGFVSYLSALVRVTDSDTLTPVDVSGVTPPSDDLAPAADLN